MITLTTPRPVNTVLGGSATVNYDKFVFAPITSDAVALTLSAVVRLSSSANPDMTTILGRCTINAGTGLLEIEVAQLDFYRRVILTAPQIAAVRTQINNSQNAMEAGLITLEIVAGVQATGA